MSVSLEPTVPAMKPEPYRPKRRGGGKLIGLVLAFFIVLFLILFFQSSLSRISEIQVSGNELTAADDIVAASGVKTGDHYFMTSASDVRKKVKKEPFIETVEVKKHFPGVLRIQVREYRRVAFQLAADGTKEVLLADGSALPVAGQAAHVPLDMPVLSNWSPDDPLKKDLCAALAQIDPVMLSDVSEIMPDASSAYPDRIKLYTRSRYEVLTTVEYLPGNVEYLGYMTAELAERGKPTGVITMLEQIRHAPFEGEKKETTSKAKAAPAKEASKNTAKSTKPGNG